MRREPGLGDDDGTAPDGVIERHTALGLERPPQDRAERHPPPLGEGGDLPLLHFVRVLAERLSIGAQGDFATLGEQPLEGGEELG
jgi:hypothetical protein